MVVHLVKEGPVTKDNENRKPRPCEKSSVGARHPQVGLSGRDNLQAHCTPLSYPDGSSGLNLSAGWPMVGFATLLRAGALSRFEGGAPHLRSVQPPRDHPQPPAVLREQE